MTSHPLLNVALHQPWVMEPVALQEFVQTVGAISPEMIRALEMERKDSPDSPAAPDEDGTATINVTGVLLKSGAWIYRAFGIEATDYRELSAAFAAAESNPSVERIMLAVDSPGGQASGIHAVADQIHNCAKPVVAHVKTLAASGGYWIASQADEIVAQRGAKVGSIGAYVAVYDTSAAAKAEGVKVHVVSSGPFKGAGVAGSPINDDQLADIQAQINDLAAEFVNDVARGRGVDATAIKESADGKVYNTEEARTRWLIDRVSADPVKESKNNMADMLAKVAALVKEFPAHAAAITESAAAGKSDAEIRSVIEKAQDADKAAKVAADRDAAIARAESAEKALAEASAKIEAQAKDLEAAKAAHDAIAKVKAGATQGNKIEVDPAEKPVVKKSLDEFNAMGGIERAKFVNAGGLVE